MLSLHDSPQAPSERTLGPDSPSWFQGPWVTPSVCSTTRTQRSGEGPFLGSRCPPLPGLPMPCWRVRSGPELVRWLGKGEGAEAAQPGDSTCLPDHSSPLHPASHGSAASVCCCFQVPACPSLGVGGICPVGTQESCKTPPALSRGVQSPIPSMEPRSSVPQPSVGSPSHSPFPRAQESLSLPRGLELSPRFRRSSCHLEPER
ncbi:PREDICTED: uncharacterized protein LOC101366371 [Odobenus rosmarus divergens]|uniref:Uncharacterized protein LOC101366371 n=1 Tax=Odobenus rosmarus divergens TaxID=9708 RepID=A0A9B0M4E9_ODORO